MGIKHKITRLIALSIITIFLIFTCNPKSFNQEMDASGKAENHGFSTERLNRLTSCLVRELGIQKTPGAAVAIYRNGSLVYEKIFGNQDLVKKIPMKKNSIFRIYSMTKPITSTAVMMLWEEGKFKLNDPVSLYLPEFNKMRVAVVNKEKTKIIRTIPSKRQITIQDLLRHTSGLTYGGFGRSTAVRQLYKNANLSPIKNTSQQFIKTISKLPLMAHPGERWEYSYSTDVLGCLVEVVSGMTLEAFFNRNIFGPLKMKDTGFHIPEDQLFRAAQGYDYKTKRYPLHLRDVSKSPRMYSGGGGLVSTVHDYARFAQMMLNRGQLDGTRLLSPKTVDLMTANHIEASVKKGDLYLPGAGHGFGLGFAVRMETGIAGVAGSKGDYRWGGWAGTGFWIDPEEQMISIYMMQDVGSSVYLRDRFKALVYQAVIE